MTDRKASFAKRQRELEQKERAAQRLAKRNERRARAANASTPDPNADPDIDPDLVGIVPGPQANPYDQMLGEEPAAPGDDDAASGDRAE